MKARLVRHPRLLLAALLLEAAACAARSDQVREITVVKAERATVTGADSGASIICVSSASTRVPLAHARVAAGGTDAEARTGTDGCAMLVQPAAEVRVTVGLIGYARRSVPVTVRRGYADTVRVLLRAGAVPSEERCREARRKGQGCL